MEAKEMYKFVGTKWEDDKDGFAWGCIAPMYLTSPSSCVVRRQWEDMKNLLSVYKENFTEKSLEEISRGDVIVLELPFGLWHIMVYVEDGKYLHCTEATDTEIIKLDDYYLHRIRGVFSVQSN